MAEKAVFMDRDDTLIEDPGYINHPNQVKLLPGAGWAISQIKKMGYKVIVISNQSAVARGIVTEEILKQIHNRMEKLFADENAYIDAIYYCPYHPEGTVPKYRKESDLRKPNPGMLLKAADEMDIDLTQSWMIGNTYHDISAGTRAGCRTILLKCHGKTGTKKFTDPTPDRITGNIREAVNTIRMYDSQTQNKKNIVTVPPKTRTVEEPEPVEQTTAPKPLEGSSQKIDTPKDTPAPKLEPQNKTNKDAHHHAEKTHRLMEEMLGHIRSFQRSEMFEDFSPMKVLAGTLQIVVVFCLLLSLWFLMDPTREITAVYTCIGYALVLQLMVIAFYIMRNRK